MKAIVALAGICSLALISIVRTDGMDACTAKHSVDVCFTALNR